MTIINPPKELREILGDAGTDALVALINRANEKQKEDVLVYVGEKFEGKLAVLEEKFERRLAEELAKVRVEIAELRSEISAVKSDVEVKIAQAKSDLEVKIAQSKTELIRWMFIFWAGQVIVLTGLLFAFFK
ncbi:MAG: hypothetical protein AB1742_10370 [bacterium]